MTDCCAAGNQRHRQCQLGRASKSGLCQINLKRFSSRSIRQRTEPRHRNTLALWIRFAISGMLPPQKPNRAVVGDGSEFAQPTANVNPEGGFARGRSERRG
jgi:hypothetical protein